MIVAFEELRVQAENTRLEMCFKCESCAYCVSAAGFTDPTACSFRLERQDARMVNCEH